MKKFILHVFAFFAIVTLIDLAIGKLFYYLQANVAGGRTRAEYYVCKESNEDIIIMGSSRASHHYVPHIITDNLGIGCFNAGQDGNGIILQYGRWKMITERYTPKLVIYDINPGYDLFKNDNMTYIDRLKPFCEDDILIEYVSNLYPMERFKLFSNMYRFNYKFFEMGFDCFNENDDVDNGYQPLYGVMREDVVKRIQSYTETSDIEYDEDKLYYMDCLARECKSLNVNLIFVVSPYFKGVGYNIDTFKPICDIAGKYDYQFYYFNDESFNMQPNMFKDSYHLNDNGAKEFTNDLIHRLICEK